MTLDEHLTEVRETLGKNGSAVLRIKVSPGAAQTRWHSLLDGKERIAKIRVVAAPERGRANALIIKFIQKSFNCSAKITSGHTSSTKTIQLCKT